MPLETGQTVLAVNSYAQPGILNVPEKGNFQAAEKASGLYSAEWRFLHSLLRDPTVRTLEPHEADLFFVPIFSGYTHTGNTGSPRADVEVASQHLKVTMPFFWQRHGGADHIFFATGDKGFCDMDAMGPMGPPQSPIYVSHFGLMSGFTDGMSAFDTFPDKFAKPARTLERQLRKNGWCFAKTSSCHRTWRRARLARRLQDAPLCHGPSRCTTARRPASTCIAAGATCLCMPAASGVGRTKG